MFGLSKIQGYLAAAGAFIVAITIAVFKGISIQKQKTKLAQKDIELKAHIAVSKADKKGRKKTDENNTKSNNGDWSDFNR